MCVDSNEETVIQGTWVPFRELKLARLGAGLRWGPCVQKGELRPQAQLRLVQGALS